ncbi:MAG: cytochrome c [Chthoniobacteraceae bacterium]
MSTVSKKSVRLLLASAVGAAFIAVIPRGFAQTAAPWVAPASESARRNPLAGNAAAAAEGKQLYMATCSPCHGTTGRGDGPAAMALNPKPANYTSSAIARESDGALFWKLSEGRGAMVGFKGAFSEAQRWQLITYIRTLQGVKSVASAAAPESKPSPLFGETPLTAQARASRSRSQAPAFQSKTPPLETTALVTGRKGAGIPGSELWTIHCNRCHTYRASNEFTAAQWGNIVMHMRVRANIPAAQAREILKYLQQGAGK